MNWVRGTGDGSDERWAGTTDVGAGGRGLGGCLMDPGDSMAEKGLERRHACCNDREVELDHALSCQSGVQSIECRRGWLTSRLCLPIGRM